MASHSLVGVLDRLLGERRKEVSDHSPLRPATQFKAGLPQRKTSPELVLLRVGVAGFEPTASSSRTKRATKLRHTPRRAEQYYPTAPAKQIRYPRDHKAAGQRGINVSTEASGRQAKRIGAVGWVPRPAETCSQASESGQRCRPLAIACGRSQFVVRAP
jgi:hypothetical protein